MTQHLISSSSPWTALAFLHSTLNIINIRYFHMSDVTLPELSRDALQCCQGFKAISFARICGKLVHQCMTDWSDQRDRLLVLCRPMRDPRCTQGAAWQHGARRGERRRRGSVERRSDASSHPSDDDANDGSVLLGRPERTDTEL